MAPQDLVQSHTQNLLLSNMSYSHSHIIFILIFSLSPLRYADSIQKGISSRIFSGRNPEKNGENKGEKKRVKHNISVYLSRISPFTRSWKLIHPSQFIKLVFHLNYPLPTNKRLGLLFPKSNTRTTNSESIYTVTQRTKIK